MVDKKKLMYRSLHRGCKEMDVLIGEFASHNLDKMESEELTIYEKLLEVEDYDIYEWIINPNHCPEEFKKITDKMREFNGGTCRT